MPLLTPRKKRILYICRENAGRSIMAEAITNHFSGRSIRAYSAGVDPRPTIPKLVLRVLEKHGIPTAGLRTRSIASMQGPLAPRFDYVFSLCNQTLGETCPEWNGQPIRSRWNIPQPRICHTAEAQLIEIETVYDIILRSVNTFLNLPLDVMEKFAVSKAGEDASLPADAAHPDLISA